MSPEATGATRPTTENSIADSLPCDATQIGIDTEGFTVYFSKNRTSIYVARDGDVVFTRDDIEPGESLVQFMDHISRTRGWETTNLFGSWPEAFAATLEESR